MLTTDKRMFIQTMENWCVHVSIYAGRTKCQCDSNRPHTFYTMLSFFRHTELYLTISQHKILVFETILYITSIPSQFQEGMNLLWLINHKNVRILNSCPLQQYKQSNGLWIIHFFEERGIWLLKQIPLISAEGRSRMEEVDTQVCVVSFYRLADVL